MGNIRFGICTGVENIDLLQRLGYDYIEMNMTKTAQMTEAEFGKALAKVQSAGIRAETFNCLFPGTLRLSDPETPDSEITGYLDAVDSSSFYEQQGLPAEASDAYGEYSRTALYAFEAILCETEKELQGELTWRPIEPDKTDWLYSGSSEQDLERGCVGHLRGDFGKSGGEFWTSWFDHQPELKSTAFHDEFQNVVDSLRKQDGLLRNFASMSRGCRDGLACEDSFGFKAESPHYTYCLRCTPRRGDYNFYLYAYDKDAQREQVLLKGRKEPEKQQMAKPKIKRNEMER